MTGLCGWTTSGRFDGAGAGDVLDAMAAGLPPSGGLVVALASDGAALGVRAEQAHAWSAADRSVVAAVDGTPWISDPELAARSRAEGIGAAVAEAYRRKGPAFLTLLRGAFALAVLEPSRGKALLAVDRMGRRSLAYAIRGDGTLVFGTTAHAVCAHPSVGRNIDHQAIYDYAYFHVVPSPDTVFTGVRKLQPAQRLVFDQQGQEQPERYWQPAFAERTATPVRELQRELNERLRVAVERCAPDLATGSFLSGGLDSSTVTGLLARQTEGTAHAYSIGFAEEGYDEMAYARLSAAHFGVELHEYYVTPADVAAAIPDVARAYDEPFGNSSAIPTLYCARLAAADGKQVLLAGDGGDELFAGNERYAKQKLFEAYWRVPRLLRERLVEPLVLGLPLDRLATPARKLRSYVEQARVPMPRRLETYNFLEREPLTRLFDAGFIARIDPEHPRALMQQCYLATPSKSLIHRMLYLDWQLTLADNDLRKVSRMAELAGIEVRYPMLDDGLVEFSALVPPRVKLKGQALRHFYKEALQGFLPEAVINKPKHGFGLPFGQWLKTSPLLQELVYDSLHALKGRQILRAAFLDELISEHRTGNAPYYGTMVWVLAMLEQWLAAHS